MRSFILLIMLSFFSNSALAQVGMKTGKLKYYRTTAGLAASDAITDSLVPKTTYGWMVCHDIGSTAQWVVVSEGADPAVDGVKLAPGACLDCLDCGEGPLQRMQIKAQAAGAGYSILMKTP